MTQQEKTLGQKVDEMTSKLSEVGAELEEKFEATSKETKKIARWLGKWRENATIETRITTIIGGFLVAVALWNLSHIIWQIMLLTGGILLITGVFDSFVSDGLEFLRDKLNSSAAKKANKKAHKTENQE